jgi:hypothetical protein
MDIKQIIADASAQHMSRVAGALDDLVNAVSAARAAGFEVRVKRVLEEGQPDRLAVEEIAASALINGKLQATLHYSVSISERQEG